MKMINCTDTRRRWDEHTVLGRKRGKCLSRKLSRHQPHVGFLHWKVPTPQKYLTHHQNENHHYVLVHQFVRCWRNQIGWKNCWVDLQLLLKDTHWKSVSFWITWMVVYKGLLWYKKSKTSRSFCLVLTCRCSTSTTETSTFMKVFHSWTHQTRTPNLHKTIFTHQKLWVGRQDSQVQKSRNARNCH